MGKRAWRVALAAMRSRKWLLACRRPADGAQHALARIFVADGILGAFVEHHQDVAAVGQLHVHGGFGREGVGIAVEVRLKDDAVDR